MGGTNGTGCLLNSSAIRTIAAEKGLKQWWIAEKLGVHRKTVSRWINGTVRRTTPSLARELAGLLGCSADRIVAQNEAELFATVRDQKAAAAVLRTSSLLDRLGPVGEWDTAETLLRGSLLPELPADVHGALLNNLSIACWRQSKIPQAELYAERAREIGEQTADPAVYANALLNIANIRSWRGETARALATYGECMSHGGSLEPRRFAAALNNTAAVLWEAGRIDESIPYVRHAMQVFAEHGRGMSCSIAHAQMALILLEKGDYAEALSNARLARAFADQDHYVRGRQTAILIEAEARAARREFESARVLVHLALEEGAKPAIMEPLVYEIAARTLRRSGDLDEARRLVEKGLACARDFPVSEGALRLEQGFVRDAAGYVAGARKSWEHARCLYERCGAPERVRQVRELTASDP